MNKKNNIFLLYFGFFFFPSTLGTTCQTHIFTTRKIPKMAERVFSIGFSSCLDMWWVDNSYFCPKRTRTFFFFFNLHRNENERKLGIKTLFLCTSSQNKATKPTTCGWDFFFYIYIHMGFLTGQRLYKILINNVLYA